MARLWRFLCSLRLGVWCGLGLAVLLLVSSLQLIYQPGLDDLGGPPLMAWLGGRQNLAATWWILILLLGGGLFCINIICCTIESLRRIVPGILRPPKTGVSSSAAVFYSPLPPAEIAPQAERILRNCGFRTLCQPANSGLTLAADRGRWWIISPQVAHLGLIILLGGLLVSASSGFKLRGLMLQPGEWQVVPEAALSLRLTDTDIEINQNGRSTIHRIPKINQPVFHHGICIYFAGADRRVQGIKLEIRDNSGLKLIRLRSGQEYEIEPGVKLTMGKIIPDFRLWHDREASSASSDYHNPAVRLSLKDHGRLVKRQWLFVRFPDFSRLGYKKLDIRLHSAEWTPYLRVDVARNPGAGAALTGGLFLVLGLAWNLLGGFKQIYLLVIPADSEGSRLTLNGSAETITRLQERLQASSGLNSG